MALVKYNNNSISSVTALGSLPAGGLNLITTNNITSGVSSSSFTSNIDSTYDTYLFKFINIHPATDHAVFGFKLRDGGSNFDATITSISFAAQHNEGDSATSLSYNTTRDLAQSTNQQPLADIGNANDEALSGTLYLFAPSSTTFVKHFIATIQSTDGYDYVLSYRNAGYANVTAAIDGIEFTCSSGNIDSGIIKMYGLSKS